MQKQISMSETQCIFIKWYCFDLQFLATKKKKEPKAEQPKPELNKQDSIDNAEKELKRQLEAAMFVSCEEIMS